jgi:Family of unknown function (DUF6502)
MSNHEPDGSFIPPLQQDLVVTPVARLLRPLVHLLIQAGITFPALCELLRELYVSVAEHEFVLEDGKAQTDSRVSLLTGIHRKEVHRLREAGAPVHNLPQALSWSSQIIARWTGDPNYSQASRPKPLPRVADDPSAPSFENLVSSVTRDVRPRAILDDWVNQNLVRIDADGLILLQEAAYIPRPGGEQQLYYFGRNLHDHIAASVANILGSKSRFFERAIHYDGLSDAATQLLMKRVNQSAMDILVDINREALKTADDDIGGDWRWTLGVYVYREAAKPKEE